MFSLTHPWHMAGFPAKDPSAYVYHCVYHYLMCRTNTSDCELFSAVWGEYEFCLLFLSYWVATWMLCRKQQWMHAYWISMPCQPRRTTHTSKVDWLIVVHATWIVFASGNCAHKTIPKGMQPHWHLHICVFHFERLSVCCGLFSKQG